MEKFQNKYRTSSHRRPHWDYSSDAFYFLTIVTQNRTCNLGRVENGEMILSEMGEIVLQEWYKSFDLRSELFLHSFVLMPNHLHTIVEINNNVNPHHLAVPQNSPTEMSGNVETNNFVELDGDIKTIGTAETIGTVETNGTAETNGTVETNGRSFLPQRLPKSISSFIAGFKSAVNTKIDDYIDQHNLPIPKYHRKNHFFQQNYHDHIIRSEDAFIRIQNYIINNPAKWMEDKLNPVSFK